MAGNDGTLNFDTKIDSSGFQKGLDGIGGAAQKGLSITSKVLGGAATAVTALGGAAIKVGSDFEAGMSEVQAVSGASGEALEQLKEKAKISIHTPARGVTAKIPNFHYKKDPCQYITNKFTASFLLSKYTKHLI